MGTLSVPDPNYFGGPVRLKRAGDLDWAEVPFAFDYAEESRGLGLADMAEALLDGRKHRASGELAYHVLDVINAIHEAAVLGRQADIESSCERPAPMPEKSLE